MREVKKRRVQAVTQRIVLVAGLDHEVEFIARVHPARTSRRAPADVIGRMRVNAIAPGAIRTGALASVLTPETEQRMLKHTPLARLGEPDDITYAALFLCSPAAAWVSGQVLTVSGGGVQERD